MSNANTIAMKQSVVDGIREKFDKAKTVVLVDYRGLTVAEDTELRNQMRQAGVEYVVLKNTMIHRATADADFADKMARHLEGPTAVAFSYDDLVAPAKILCDYSKKIKKMAIKCGVCDGDYLEEDGVQALANLPSKEVLIAKIMGSIMSSVSKFVYLLEALRKQRAEGEGEAQEQAAPEA